MQPTKQQITAFHSKKGKESKIEYLCEIFRDPTEYLLIEKEIGGEKFGIEVTNWTEWADNLNNATKQLGKRIFANWKDAFEADLLNVSTPGPVILYEINKLVNSPLSRNLADYGKKSLAIYDGEAPYLIDGEFAPDLNEYWIKQFGTLKANAEGVAVFEKLKYLVDLQKNDGAIPAVDQIEKVDFVERYLSAFESKYRFNRDQCTHAKNVLRRFFRGVKQDKINCLDTPAGSFEVLCTMLYQIFQLEKKNKNLTTEFIDLVSQLFPEIKANLDKFQKSAKRGNKFLNEKLGI